MPPNDGLSPVEGQRRPTAASDFPRTGPFSLAAPGQRFAARAVDLAIVALPALLCIALSTEIVAGWFEFRIPFWLGPAVFLLGSLYEATFVALFGQTPGKWIFGLRVVRMADGRRPGPAQALLRAMLPWLWIALPMGVLAVPAVVVVYGSAIAGELHRGIPDSAGGTVVISTR